jgi:hypothetical protein
MKLPCILSHGNLLRIVIIAVLLAGTGSIKPSGLAYATDAGWALEFDGHSDLVSLDKTTSIIGSGWQDLKSVSLWVKPIGQNLCTDPDAANCPNIFGDQPRLWGISIGLIPRGHHGGLDRIWIWNHSGGEQLIGLDYTPGEWVHITLVHSGGVLMAYKNGFLRGSVASGTTIIPPNAEPTLYLGGVVGGGVWLFHGQIDEVRVWNRALTALEITQNMFNTIPGNTAGLAAYYQMSDGTGHTLTDDSQFSWNGTLLDGHGVVPSDGTYPLWVTSDAFVVPSSPAAPTGFSATVVTAFRVDLLWADNADNESDYEVERCTGVSCSDFALLLSLPANTQAYSDTSTQPITPYCYRVRATNAGGPSAYAGPSCLTTPLAYLYLPSVFR